MQNQVKNRDFWSTLVSLIGSISLFDSISSIKQILSNFMLI